MRRVQRVALAAVFILSACAAPGNGGDATLPAPDPDLVATGAELHATSCASCHGVDLRGTERGPSHLSEIYEPNHHADAAFLLAVRRGVAPHHWSFGPMPVIEGLSDEEVEAIVAFVREAQRREGFEPYPP